MTRKFDQVLIDGKYAGTVVQDGCQSSLVSTAGAQRGTNDLEWYDNDRLTVTARRTERLIGNEPSSVSSY